MTIDDERKLCLLDEHENSSKDNWDREPGCIYTI
jgi:hypothetical protein